MVKYSFQLGSRASSFRFKAHFALEGDMYLVLPPIVKISFHKSGQCHFKPTSGGKPICFDGHEFMKDIYDKKSRMFTRTSEDLPERAGAIGVIRPEKLLDMISAPQFKKTFNPRKIVADPALFGDAFTGMNFRNLRVGLDTLSKNGLIGEKDLAIYCHFENDEICFSHGNMNTRFELRLNLHDEKSLNQIPGYEVVFPATKQPFQSLSD
jgi:hypothetical protein